MHVRVCVYSQSVCVLPLVCVYNNYQLCGVYIHVYTYMQCSQYKRWGDTLYTVQHMFCGMWNSQSSIGYSLALGHHCIMHTSMEAELL